MVNELKELIDPIIRLAKKAGERILYWYERPEQLNIQRKADKSQLTSADINSHEILCEGLQDLSVQWPILSEEGEIAVFDERKQWERFWLLDPLDGTRGFINRVDEFTVNVALIVANRSVLGVIYSPVTRLCYFAYQGGGAFVQQADQKPQPIHTEPIDFDKLRFIVGRYHASKRMERILNKLPGSELLRVNSSLKFVRVAEGNADVYPRFGNICEWDIAAGHCILDEAGGKVVDFNGESLQYNLRESLLCPDLLAVGDPTHIDRLITLFEENAS